MRIVLFSALHVPSPHEANLSVVVMCCFVRSVVALQLLIVRLVPRLTHGLRPKGPGLLPIKVSRETCIDFSSSWVRAENHDLNAALSLSGVFSVTWRNITFLSLHLILGKAVTLSVPHQEKEVKKIISISKALILERRAVEAEW